MPRDSHRAGLRRVVKLTVTAFLPDLSPSISFEDENRVPNLHQTRVPRKGASSVVR